MPNTALSLVVTKEMLDKLQKADDKLKQLAKTSDATSKKIITSFQKINTQGIGAFINRLDEAQRKLSQLGSTKLNLGNANNIQAMTDAINRLSQASRTNITINGIDTVGNQATKAMDAINRLIATLGQLQNTGGMQSFNQVNVLGRETLKEMNKEAKRMERTLDSLDKSIAKYGISATELANKLAQARQAQEQFNENAKRQAQSDVNGLLGMRGQQRTLNELKNYANELKRTMANLDPQSKEWQQLNKVLDETNKKINDIQGAMKGVKGKTNSLMHTLNRFRQLVGVAFSISRITNFANKLMNVRKEFEMQQRSLQALLQNKDEADKLWQKTIDLAVKSPFRVKELVTYTKQLAAYRIESDKLYETNKMLADISAGLGVDMQRLILAYGQVKAANYLRGTELRQFSEAGVNILGELSKYFTELEGRAVSVGDVFERVSKRMVSFSDVEEIFKRLTSAGGTFYRMQEIQSETLKGLLSNLGDSIDIMLNDIGREHDSTLKGAVGSVRNLVENWREIAFVLEKVAYSMTIAKLSSLALAKGLETSGDKALWFSKYFSSLNGVTLQQATQIKATGQGWTKFLNILKASGVKTLATIQGAIYGVGAALKSMIPVAIIALIIEIWRQLTKASRQAKLLQKNLQGIFNEDTTNLNRQIDAYKDLVTRLEQANKGSKERNDIIGKLNSQYGEYLNFVVDEQTSIQNLSDAYEDVVKRMKEKQALATFEKGMDAIAKSYSDSLQDAKDEFYDLFKGQSIVNTKSSFSGIVPTKEEVDDIYAIVQQRVRELNADQIDNLSEQSKLIQEIIKDYYGEDFALSRDYGKSIELLDILVDKKEKERELQKDINAQYGETLTSREANLALEKLQNEYAEKRRNIEKSGVSKFDINKQLNELAKLEKLDIIDLKVRFNIITPESGAIEKDKIINWATNITKSVNETIQKELGNIFSEEDLAKVLINEDMQKSQSIGEYVKGISSAWEQQNEIIAEQISLKSEGHTIDEELLNNATRMEELYRKVAKLLGIELKYEERINEETRKSINDKLPLEYQISLEESLKSQASLLEEANKKKEDAIKLQAMYNASQKQGVSISEEQLKEVENEVKYWTLRWELLGGTKKQGGSDRSNSLYDERIKVIDDMNKKYKELNKTLSKSESLQGAFDAYIDAFASAFEGISWIPKNVKSMTPQEFASQVLNFPNENDLVRFLDELAKEPMKAFEKIKVELAKGEYVYDMKVRAKIEEDENLLDQIEEMFSGYEISLELQKLNIPKDWAKDFFDIDALSLDELKEKVDYAFTGVEFYSERVKDAGKLMQETFKGNVDLLNRELIPAQELAKKGWEDVGDGIATVFSSSYSVQDASGKMVDILVTPILPDGTVLSQKELEDYIAQNIEGAQDILKADKKGIIIHSGEGLDKEIGDYLHSLQEVYYAMDMLSEDQKAKYKEFLEKIKEMEVKAQQERLKTYLQYARDAVGDRAKIKLEEMKKLQEIEKTFTKPEQQEVKQKAIDKVRKDSEQELNKLEWEEFQKSDTFIRLFSDLDSASSLLINHALEKLKEFKDEWKDMPLEDMRAIVSKIDELELALGKINPFRGLKVLKEQIKKAQQEAVFTDIEAQTFANNGDYAKAYEQELIFQQKRKQEADKQIADLETVIQLKEEGNKYDKVAINLNKNQQGLYNNSVESLKEMLATQQGISNDSQNQSDVMSANLAQIKAQVVYLQAQADAINTAQDMANNLYDAFKGLNEVLGGGDSIGAMFADMGMQMLNTVFQTIALQAQLNAAAVAAEGLGVALNSAMGVIGWIVMGVNLIVQGLTAIFNAKDKRLSNQIETLTRNVEDLDRALAKLEERIDSAFSLTGVSLGTKDAIKNLQSQIYSYERMIKLEKDKKKTDTDAVRQYENAIKDLQDRQRELEKEAVSSATSGILDSTRDAARQFVDAWYEAFAETGDGLQGLKDNFKEIMLDMIQQQASMTIAGNFLNRWKAQLDKYINADDLELTTREASNWMRSVQEELPMLNEALQNYFTAMEQAGLDLSKTGEMSGLQRGIQSVTEETAQALEALLNSTRFFVADSNAKLTLLVDSFINPESANPMLSELRSQTDLIRTIRDMFSSVIGRGDSTHSGAYLKVVM